MSERLRALVAGVGILAALVTGYFGSWLGDAVIGNATRVEIDRCYLHYSRLEVALYRCEGYWNQPRLAHGPVIGVNIDITRAVLVDPNSRREFGYEITRESYDHSALAVIRGDAAVIVPTVNLVLAPVGLVATVACAAILIAPALRRRRVGDVRTGSAVG